MNTSLKFLFEKISFLSALRYPRYRLYFIGTIVAINGFNLWLTAQLWHVWDLTGEPRYFAFLGMVVIVPTLILNLFGGVAADKLNKRYLIIYTQLMAGIIMLIIAIITFTGHLDVWQLIIGSAILSAVLAFDTPSRQSIWVQFIDRKDLVNAVSLNSASWQVTRVTGPAIGGFIISRFGIDYAYFFISASYIFMVIILLALKVPAMKIDNSSVIRGLGEGLGFVRKNSLFLFLIGMTFFNSVFGMSFATLLPVFAEDILKVGSVGYGNLMAVSGVGALCGVLATSYISSNPNKGLLLISGATLFGVTIIGFALSTSYGLSMFIMFLIGAFNFVYMVIVVSTIQSRVPDHFRGRVMGIYSMTWGLLPLGAIQSGFIAQFTSAPFALIVGGVAVILFALGPASFNPQIRRLKDIPADSSN